MSPVRGCSSICLVRAGNVGVFEAAASRAADGNKKTTVRALPCFFVSSVGRERELVSGDL